MAKPQESRPGEVAPSPTFRFKQFTVRQQHAAMKVGFDGILLGAWCCVVGYKRILDVGTGTGLIALMIAQRTAADSADSSPRLIDAVEVDEAAAREALFNFANSPWGERLHLHHQKFQTWRVGLAQKYDLVVCNPPYFSSHPASTPRSAARQDSLLNWSELFEGASSILSVDGRLSLIVPYGREEFAIQSARQQNLFPCRKLVVRSMPDKPPHRVLFEFASTKSNCEVAELAIEVSRHAYTSEFRQLTQEFYLKF